MPLSRVPRPDADPTQLAAFVTDHAAQVADGSHRLPVELRAPFDDARLVPPALALTDAPLLRAFQRATCSGCHSVATGALDEHFHVSPRHANAHKLSGFMTKRGGELELRRAALEDRLCEPR
jgi:hypothetical protein